MNNVKSYLKPIVISLIILIALITLFFFYTDLHEEREPPGSKPVCLLDLSNHDNPGVSSMQVKKLMLNLGGANSSIFLLAFALL